MTGRVGDRFGYLKIICLGMMLLGLSVFGATHASQVFMLFASAALAGIAQALIFSNNIALVAQRVSKTHLGFSLGLEGSLANAGKVVGPVIAGFMIEALDYTSTFRWLSLGLILFAVMLLVLHLVQSRKENKVLAGGTD
jgi:MFS family permease